jgi:hypothetical protein
LCNLILGFSSGINAAHQNHKQHPATETYYDCITWATCNTMVITTRIYASNQLF